MVGNAPRISVARTPTSASERPAFLTSTRLLLLGLLALSWGTRIPPRLWVAGASSGDRGNTFQVLADGTQDLAALVGLFATESVEGYSVNYSRGYMSSAMALCSILGILGYVRALIKLALGSEKCQKSGFATAPVRMLLGVSELDKIPREDLVSVYYIAATRSQSNTGETCHYKLEKTVDHTVESFPLGHLDSGLAMAYRFKYFQLLSSERKGDALFFVKFWGAHILAAATTTFPVLFISRVWTWSRVLASFVLFGALATSSVMWSYVYIKEQVPFLDQHDIGSDGDSIAHPHRFEAPVALFHQKSGIYPLMFAKVTGVVGRELRVFRVVSFLCAVLIVLGYICQYAEIRKSTTSQAATWLSIQAALALVRVAVWVWEPQWDNLNFWPDIDERNELDSYIEAFDIAFAHFSLSENRHNPLPLTFKFPSTIYEALRKVTLVTLLERARNIAAGTAVPEALTPTALIASSGAWKFDQSVFYKWLGIQSREPGDVGFALARFGCSSVFVIIEDDIYMIPTYISRLRPGLKMYIATGSATLMGVWYGPNGFEQREDTEWDREQQRGASEASKAIADAIASLLVSMRKNDPLQVSGAPSIRDASVAASKPATLMNAGEDVAINVNSPPTEETKTQLDNELSVRKRRSSSI